MLFLFLLEEFSSEMVTNRLLCTILLLFVSENAMIYYDIL